MEFILILVMPTIAAYVAQKRGRSGLAWFLLTLFGTPFVILILYALPKYQERGKKTCPRCAETIKVQAKVCHFCQYEFSTISPSLPRGNAGALDPFYSPDRAKNLSQGRRADR